jgi:ABC-type transport system substrate-binding protein
LTICPPQNHSSRSAKASVV